MVKIFSVISGCLLFSFIGLCLFLQIFVGIPFDQIFSSLAKLATTYYHPHYNGFTLPVVHGINILLVSYFFMGFAFVGLLLAGIWGRRPSARFFLDIGSTSVVVTVIVFVVLLLLQTKSQGLYFADNFVRFHDKNVVEKVGIINNIDSYNFVQFCLRYLSGRYQGQLVTESGADQTIDPYIIKYYLYPVVDTRGGPRDKKCLLVFNKKDPVASVPKDYEVVGVFNDRGLLAVQRE